MENKYLTIRQTAKAEKLPEHRLRQWRAQGVLPGFFAGSRFYVDVVKLRAMLDKLTEAAMEINAV